MGTGAGGAGSGFQSPWDWQKLGGDTLAQISMSVRSVLYSQKLPSVSQYIPVGCQVLLSVFLWAPEAFPVYPSGCPGSVQCIPGTPNGFQWVPGACPVCSSTPVGPQGLCSVFQRVPKACPVNPSASQCVPVNPSVSHYLPPPTTHEQPQHPPSRSSIGRSRCPSRRSPFRLASLNARCSL